MLYIFTEISKYLILGFMLLYVIECMLYEAKGERYTKSTGIYIRQDIYIVIIQALGYATLCLKSGKLDYAFFGLFVQIVLFGCIILSYMFYPRIDRVLLNNMALLLSIGFIILSRLDFNKALKQFAIASVSIIIGMFIPLIMEKLAGLKDLGYLYAGIGLAMLLIVLILGSTTYGSKINYTIAGITFQPSEIVKLIYVFCVAALLGRAKSFVDVCIATLIAAIHVIVLVLSRDLGSGLIFFVTYKNMVFVSDV